MTGPFHPTIVVDTCVFSFIFNKKPESVDYLPYVDTRTCFLTFMGVAELFYGAHKRNWGHSRQVRLKKAIDNYSLIRANDKVARVWAYVTASSERKGRTIPINDSWHAACAITYNLPFLTHNIKDFENIDGLTLIGPNIP